MDRDALARGQRLRQAREALEFEQARADALAEQIEEIVAETEGPRVDEEAFATMDPEDVEVVRALLHPPPAVDDDDEWLAAVQGSLEPDDDEPGEDPEEEIARLETEIEESRRRQRALERYIAALSGSATTMAP